MDESQIVVFTLSSVCYEDILIMHKADHWVLSLCWMRAFVVGFLPLNQINLNENNYYSYCHWFSEFVAAISLMGECVLRKIPRGDIILRLLTILAVDRKHFEMLLLEFYWEMSPFTFTGLDCFLRMAWKLTESNEPYNGHGDWFQPAAILRMGTFSATANNRFKWKLYFN